jgi:hypothetical protein
MKKIELIGLLRKAKEVLDLSLKESPENSAYVGIDFCKLDIVRKEIDDVLNNAGE